MKDTTRTEEAEKEEQAAKEQAAISAKVDEPVSVPPISDSWPLEGAGEAVVDQPVAAYTAPATEDWSAESESSFQNTPSFIMTSIKPLHLHHRNHLHRVPQLQSFEHWKVIT